MESMKLTITGTSMLLQHNPRLADPLDPHTQALAALTKKAKKTLDNHKSIGRTEFEGGLYIDADGPYVPAAQLLKSIRDAAALHRDGKKIQRGVVSASHILRLRYRGPKDVQGMWDAGMYDRRSAAVSNRRVMRTRPRFDPWALDVELLFAVSLIDRATLRSSVEEAGKFMGLGDGRVLGFGRFDVAEIS